MIVVELIKMLRRPRTWLIIGMLVALPTLVAILLAITDLGPRPGTGPPFLSAVLNDGTLFPLAALGVVLPLLLPIAVAVLGGDAIAGESQTGTLRYLLVRPVGRTHLLLAKLATVVAFVLLAVLVVAAVSTPRPPAARASSGYRNGESERLHADPAGAHLANRARTWLRDHLHARRCRGRAVLLHLDAVRDRRSAGHDRPPRRLDRAPWPGCGECAPSVPADPPLACLCRLVPRPHPVAGCARLVVQFGYLTVFTLAAWANFGTKDIDD